MTHYEGIIAQATGCTPGEAAEIEDYVRNIVVQSDTLDWLSEEELSAAARTAKDDLEWMASPEGRKHIASLLP